jgi:hypothetical protein
MWAKFSILVLLAAYIGKAVTLSYSGSLPGEDQRFVLDFTVNSSSQLRAETFNDSIGGFVPVLSLFRNLELFTVAFGMPGEAIFQSTVPTGDYRLVLTVLDNLPNGPTYDDGFTRDGQGAFTASTFFGTGPYSTPNGDPRSPNFLLQLTGDITVPEPSTYAITALALALLLSRKS